MPQGRRKTPFSGKAKKEQLKAKKAKAHKPQLLLKSTSGDESSEDACGAGSSHSKKVQKLNFQSGKSESSRPNRYALQFFRESEAEISRRKELARQQLQPKGEMDLEVDGESFYPANLDFPKRPPWSYDLSKEQLEAKEQRYFTEYLNKIEAEQSRDVSYFELNLETWRQLWRVLEMSDVILFIVDIRFAGLMFPPSLYNYITKDLNKDFILVLNKIDLAPAGVVVAWKHYFQAKYPNLHIVMFTSVPGYNLMGRTSDKGGLQERRRKGRLRMATEGTLQIYEACTRIVSDSVDLTAWQEKIKEESQATGDFDERVEAGEEITLKSVDTNYFQYEKFKNNVLTIGCVGQPNVGKSSLLNAVMGRKVVSVSKTPGHTKHFQTIFLTNNVKLCDCPGLVFPSLVPKQLQVLVGSFPIAQLREPFTTIQFIAERLDLVKLLRIDHPYGDDSWSAMDICDGWAKKRGFLTAKAARLDSFRAANNLLRMALDGKICLNLMPINYHKNIEYFNSHADIEKVKWIQAITNEDDDRTEDNIGDHHQFSEDEYDDSDNELSSREEEDSPSESDDNSESSAPIPQILNKFALLDS